MGQIAEDRFRENRNEIDEYGEDVSHCDRWILPEPVETEKLTWGNMSFRASALAALGGFDTAYSGGPAYFEETHVMAQLQRRGETLVYHPAARVSHL